MKNLRLEKFEHFLRGSDFISDVNKPTCDNSTHPFLPLSDIALEVGWWCCHCRARD